VPATAGPRRRPRLRYRAAQAKAEVGARRPKPGKLAVNVPLHSLVKAGLMRRWSPQQISRELARCLRSGRALRRPQRRTDPRRTPIKDMVLISERPAEVADRAVPGHWEGDLILGKGGRTAIGTLIERSTRFCRLLHLPDGFDPLQVRDAMIATMGWLPTHLRRTLTWDQGLEMRRHREIGIALDLPISSPIRTAPGSEAAARTPTGCPASTSPRAPTSRCTPQPTWSSWPPNSTADPA
jgi:IS30 family transposase